MSADLHKRFHAVWKRQTALHLLRAGCHVLAWCVGLMFVTLAVDWWLDLPPYGRLAAAAASLALAGLAAYRRSLRHVRRYDPLRIALRLEDGAGAMDSLLVAYVELDERRPPPGISPELIAAARQDALRRAQSLRFEQIISLPSLRRAAPAALAAVLAVAGFGLVQPQALGVFTQRMLNPFFDAWYPTRTVIESFSGDLTVKRFDPVELRARAGGEVPQRGSLHVKAQGGAWERIELDRADANNFSHAFAKARTSFEYYFRIGDARIARGSVTVAYPPRIVASDVELDYPKYTGLGRQPADTCNLKLPEGTGIRWNLKLDRQVQAAEMITESGTVRQMELLDDGRVVSLSLRAEESTSYRFAFKWLLGGRENVQESARYFIRVIPDQVPVVDLTFPREDEKATLKKNLTISFVARDDYGLAGASIIYSINDFREQRKELDALGGKVAKALAPPGWSAGVALTYPRDAEANAPGETINCRSADNTVVWSPLEAFPDLKVGDIITYAIEVCDESAGRSGPQAGRSKSRRVQFVSDAQYDAYVQELYRKNLAQVRPLYVKERDAFKRVGSLIRELFGNLPSGALAAPGAPAAPSNGAPQ